MLSALRYYWLVSKGYRLHPWDSPYLRWRLETFFGKEAADLDARGFLRVLWQERTRLRAFLRWVDQRWRDQRQ